MALCQTVLTSHQALGIGLVLLVGAAGKSALIPFSGWLPRAMEGPTASSAIFYGALSVHLGAYLLLRVSPLIAASPLLGSVVVACGLATAAYASLVERVQGDIKSSLAFASLTQVGLIIAEIGLGWHYLALVHLLGHAMLRTVQLLRAPSLLRDYFKLESALGYRIAHGAPPRWLTRFPRWNGLLYRFALERGHFDVLLDRYLAGPVLALFRWCDRCESRWIAAWEGRCRASDPQRSVAGSQASLRVYRGRRWRMRDAMPELHAPWLEIAIFLPLVAAGVVAVLRRPRWAWLISSTVSALVLLVALVDWLDFTSLQAFEAHDPHSMTQSLFGHETIVVDEFNAPLLALVAALYLAVIVITPTSKRDRFPFGLTLASLSLTLALLSSRSPVTVIGLLVAQNLLPLVELIKRRQVWQFFACHQGLSVVLVVMGWGLINPSDLACPRTQTGVAVMAAGLLIRCGCLPLHCWIADLLERVSMGTALLFVTPMAGAYCLVRLVLPIADESILEAISLMSLLTAIYASGMVLVQRSTRRFYGYLFLSNSSLLLVGLESRTPTGLTGSLSLWLSMGIALVSLGVVLRAIEGRVGRTGLVDFHGLYQQMPLMAAFFMLALLASIGFPGTVGFVGVELLVESAMETQPLYAPVVVMAVALNGIAALRVYFRLFTGKPAAAAISCKLVPLNAVYAFSADRPGRLFHNQAWRPAITREVDTGGAIF